jgi:hypothetical protein
MPITRTPMIDDDGSGTTGTIINNAWKTEFYNQIDAVVVPAPDYVSLPPGNFSGNGGMTWVPDFYPDCYFGFAGGFILLSLYMASSTIGGTPSTQLKISGFSFCTFVVNNNVAANALAQANGTALQCFVQPIDGHTLGIVQTNYAPFPAGPSFTFGFNIIVPGARV